MSGDDFPPAAAAYLAAVRDELGDLPADDLAEMVDDLREHLTDVLAELGTHASGQALVDRLGPPSEYAAELRRSAGMNQPEPARPAGFGRRLGRFLVALLAGTGAVFTTLAVVGVLFVDDDSVLMLVPAVIAVGVAAACLFLLLLRADDRWSELARLPGAGQALRLYHWVVRQPWGAPTLDYLRSLRPAWWLARAMALGVVVGYLGTASLGLAVFLLSALASVWLGRRTTSGAVTGGRLWALNVANAGLAIAGVGVAISAVTAPAPLDRPVATEPTGYEDPGPAHSDYPVHPGAYLAAGDEVTNIFPYGPDGTLLTGVRLYDQNGTPLEIPVHGDCRDDAYPDETFVVPNPWAQHVFPRESVTADEHGECGEPDLQPPHGHQLPALDGPHPPADTTTGDEPLGKDSAGSTVDGSAGAVESELDTSGESAVNDEVGPADE